MKKSLLLLTTILSLNISNLTAAAAEEAREPISASDVTFVTSRAAATADDLSRIRSHVLGYAGKFGLSETVEVVGKTGCCGFLSTTFDAAQRFLLNELAGQLLTRFLALALDDLADGKLDGIAHGKKISYAQEIAGLLGVSVSEEELRAAPADSSLLVRIVGLATDVTGMIVSSNGQKDELLKSAEAFAKKKMDKARKALASALVREADRIIELELGNGAIDGLDKDGHTIDWSREMKTSIERSLSQVLDGVL